MHGAKVVHNTTISGSHVLPQSLCKLQSVLFLTSDRALKRNMPRSRNLPKKVSRAYLPCLCEVSTCYGRLSRVDLEYRKITLRKGVVHGQYKCSENAVGRITCRSQPNLAMQKPQLQRGPVRALSAPPPRANHRQHHRQHAG